MVDRGKAGHMTRSQRSRRRWIAGLAAAFVLGCGSDGPSGNDGSIQVAIAPPSLSLPQGASGSVTASLTRGGGFEGEVTLAISGLPTGVTTTITPPQLSGTTVSATVGVTVASNVATGTYTATITATAQGVGQATATYQLTVTAAGDFALAVAPTTRTIVAGASSSATVGINRAGFPGAVALTLLNPPAGITGAFDPTPATTDASALVVSVAANVTPGTYPLTIQGTATGPAARTTTFTVTVPNPPSGGNVEYQICDPAEVPAFLAYQDGNGPWLAVTGSTSGGTTRYTLNLTQTRGGVMFVFPPEAAAVARLGRTASLRIASARSAGSRTRSLLEAAWLTQVLYASTVELAQDALESCAQTQPTKTITGTVQGVAAGAYGIVSVGGVTDIFNGAAPANPMTFEGVPPGLFDVAATRTTPGNAPNKIIVFRNLAVADGGALPSLIDFNGPASAVPATATATVSGGGGDDLEIFVDLVTANSQGGIWSDLSPSPLATRPWGGLASMETGDLHGLVVFATPPGSVGDFRVAVKYVGPVADHNLALGPVLAAPASSQVAAGAYPRFRFQGALPADYNKGASIDLVGDQGDGNVFGILATGAWLAAAGNPLAYDFTMPDVSGLAGFPAAARLTAGINDVSASGFGFTGTGVFGLQPSLGSEFKAAVRVATVTVP